MVPTGLYLPGGGIDDGESPERALLRELREETGLDGEIVRHLGHADQRALVPAENAAYVKRGTFFHVVVGGEPAPDAEHDCVWVEADEALERLTDGAQVWALERYLESE